MTANTKNEYQRIQDGIIENLTLTGRDIQAFAQSEAAHSVLSGAGLDHGFMDGGCYLFAQALKAHLAAHQVNATLICAGRPGVFDHVAVEVALTGCEPVYLDADGLATTEELNLKMTVLESCKDSEIVPLPAESDSRFILLDYRETGLPAQLARVMSNHLGDLSQLAPPN